MLVLLFFIIFIAIYFYSFFKTKKTIKNNVYVQNKSIYSYYLYYLGLISFIPALIIFIVGNCFKASIIRLYVTSFLNIPDISMFTIKSIFMSIEKAKNLTSQGVNILKISNLSHYLSNSDILFLIGKYNFINNLLNLSLAIIALMIGVFLIHSLNRKITNKTNFRKSFEKIINKILELCAYLAIILTLCIIISLSIETIEFFTKIPFLNFILGTNWSPENADFDPMNSFGILPLLSGTFLISLIAIVIALVLAIPTAIYINEYLPKKLRVIIKSILEILAGIPTIVYGFFASLSLSPLVVSFLHFFNLNSSNESALIAGIVIGVMIIPFITSLTDDILNSIPDDIKMSALAIGAMKHEVISKVLFPIALPGIISSILLAISRAIGETMIVVMASGLVANLTFNPLNSVTTITTQIVYLIQGDQEFGSSKTLSAFALGFTLFILTLVLNLIAYSITKKFEKKI